MRQPNRQSGFSLIEIIVVMVLLGIVGSVSGLLITKPIEAYRDQLRRQQIVDQGEMALRQIARDVRRALPNSLRVTSVGSGFALEMVNTVDGARYRDEVAPLDYVTDADWLDFTAVDDQFNLLGLLNNPAEVAGTRVVIYNTSVNIYDEAVMTGTNQGIITHAGINLTVSPAILPPIPGGSDPEHRIMLSAPFRFTQQSPGQRAFFVDGPISYICDPTSSSMLRYSGYNFVVAQPTVAANFSGGVSGPVVTRLTGCTMTYDPGTSQRGGMVTVTINIGVAGEEITLLNQMHVVNLP